MPISAEFPFEKRRVDVLGKSMAYVEGGTGDPIVFLHGNPTSSPASPTWKPSCAH